MEEFFGIIILALLIGVPFWARQKATEKDIEEMMKTSPVRDIFGPTPPRTKSKKRNVED